MLTVNYKQKFNVEELTLTNTVWSGWGTRGGSCREHTGTMLRLERGAPWGQENMRMIMTQTVPCFVVMSTYQYRLHVCVARQSL